MKRTAYRMSLVGAAALLLLAAVPTGAGAHGWWGHARRAHAWHGHRWHVHHHHSPRIYIGVGSALRWGPPLRWYASPPSYAYPPRVVIRKRPVYIQREPEPPHWYYCKSAGAYYPSVPACPEPWVKVPPRVH